MGGDKSERNREIWRKREGGITLKALASEYGITQERVRQVCFKQTRIIAKEKNEDIFLPVEAMKLTNRSQNGLRRAGILYVWELVRKTPAELIKTRNLGRRSLQEIQEELERMGLSLGMKLTDLPPKEGKMPKELAIKIIELMASRNLTVGEAKELITGHVLPLLERTKINYLKI